MGSINRRLLNRDLKISVAGCQLEEALDSPGSAQRHDDLVGVDVLDGLFAGQERKTSYLDAQGVGSGFNWVCESGLELRQAKMTHQERKKIFVLKCCTYVIFGALEASFVAWNLL
jgi:hypothetical protein